MTISVPLLRSFETERVAFFRNWNCLFPAILMVGFVFIVWDICFTAMGVWGFNDAYITGFRVFDLPLEEWGFFVVVPYASVFTYEVLNYFVKKDILKTATPAITSILCIGLLLVGIFNVDKIYTAITFLSTAIYLGVLFLWAKPAWLSRFYLAYLVVLLPFFMVNGVLTYLPVVWYNNAENLGIRLGSIPVEDVFYGFLLLLMNVHIYQVLKTRKLSKILIP